jgi:hypothetical protein
MHMKKTTLTFLIYSILASIPAMVFAETAAVPGLDLSTAVTEGAQNSPELKRLQAETENASWKRLETVSPQMPHLSFGFNQVLDTKYAYLGVHFGGAAVEFPSAMPSSTLDLSASLMLFDGLESSVIKRRKPIWTAPISNWSKPSSCIFIKPWPPRHCWK